MGWCCQILRHLRNLFRTFWNHGRNDPWLCFYLSRSPVFLLIGMQFLDFFDFISNSVIMPIVALVTCIFVGYFIKPKTLIEEIENGNTQFKSKKLFVVMVKYIAPIFIVLILISSVLSAFGFIKIWCIIFSW